MRVETLGSEATAEGFDERIGGGLSGRQKSSVTPRW
jgi:hypothetical protein